MRTWCALAGGVFFLAWTYCETSPADGDLAQATPAPQRSVRDESNPTKSATNAELRGVVVNESGASIAHAKVTARGYQAHQTVETAADGSFAIPIAKKPAFFVLICAKDQTGSLQGWVRLQDPKAVEKQTHIRLMLKKPREIAITVTDQSGRPVARATVDALTLLGLLERTETDAAGKALLSYPAGLSLRSVLALKPNVGLDYVDYFQRMRRAGDPKSGLSELDSQLKFVLGGARTVNVRVTDRQGKPVADAHVSPQTFVLPNKGALHLSDEDLLAQVTDSQGKATFPYIPSATVGKMQFRVRLADHVLREPAMFDPQSKSGEITAVLVPLERVRGRVTTAEQRPAVAAEVQISGVGYESDDFQGAIKCDSHGEFELRVPPNKYYTFSAHRDRAFALTQNRTILAGATLEPLKFELKTGTRIYGRVTRAKDKAPAGHQFVSLQLNMGNDYYQLPKEQRLPNPQDSRRWIGAQLSQNVETDPQGRFEFYVAPGDYNVQLNGAWDQPPPMVKVKDQDEIEVELVDSRPARSVLRGRVVLKSDPKRGVAEAQIEAVSTDKAPGFNDVRTFADQDGKFEFNRSEINMLVWAREGFRAGAVRIASDDKTVVVPLAPTATATGKFVDSETGLPAANKRIDYGVQLPEKGGPFAWHFGGSATTDAEGRFTMDRLTGGLKYQIEAVVSSSAEGPREWQLVSTITPEVGERINLGELKFPGTARPYTPPTLEKLIGQAMDSKKPLDARLKDDCHEARLFENHVLILAASPENAACRRFFSILHRRDTRERDGEARDTLDNFRLLALDVSKPEHVAELKRLLAQSDAPSISVHDATFAVVDGEGHLIAVTTAKKLWPDKTMDAKSLTAFLKQHLPPMPDVQRQLADALAKARRENKRVLVEQSAAWCGWCHVLAKYLDKHRSLVEKDYVWITVDPRFKHGEEVIKKLRPKAEGGIPWVAILDADGKPLITSDGPEGNMGYPAQPKEAEHFEKMLRTTARHLSDAEIKILVADALKK